MYKVIDLFSGVGGLSYGFAHDTEFQVVAANEILTNMAIAYSLNHPKVKMYNTDIKDFGIQDLKRDLGLNVGDIDIIVGGPPCQAYSTVGKRLIDDPRAKLFQEYFRLLSEIQPKMFVFENVKGLLSMQNGQLIHTIVDLFKSLGYIIKYRILNAADYGAPQIRERVIIVGTKLNGVFEYPEPTHTSEGNDLFRSQLKPYITLGEALGDLPVIESGEKGVNYPVEPQNDYQRLMRANAPAEIMDHEVPKNNEKLVKLMNMLPDGGTPLDLPEEMRPTSGFGNSYCRLWWNKPSTTITRNFGCPSSARCVHPKSARPLTTREGARLQGFPDDYKFYGSRADKNLQIGNAVPTFLAKAVKDAIKEYLHKYDK